MKTIFQFKPLVFIYTLLLFTIPVSLYSQQKTEKIQTLSKKAVKGYMFEASMNEAGNLEVIYKLKSGKDKVVHEIYEFDKSLNLIGSKEKEEYKTRYAERPQKTNQQVFASVGGGTSFTILSTKLNLYTRTVTKTWDVEKQRYISKTSNQKEIKPKNAENRTFNGNVSYQDDNGTLYLLVSSPKTNDKNDKNKEYSFLKVSPNLDLKEFPITFDRQHVLTYALTIPKGNVDEELNDEDADYNEISNHDMLFVFAPTSGNLKEYTFIQFDTEGKVKHRFTVNAPKTLMAITAHNTLPDGTAYLCALSVENKNDFQDVLGEYAPIVNPYYLKYGTPNYRMETHERKMEKTTFSDFLVLKIKDGKLQWMNTTPISDFKAKLKTPPAQKSGYSYNGKRFVVNNFYTTPDEGFIITGQVKTPVFKQAPNNIQYKDLVCMRIDNKGNVVSQFSYKPNTDSKSIIFPIPQEVISGKNKNHLYWINYEVKAVSGYSSFFNAFNGVKTIYANYYPSVGKINLQDNSISNFDIMGGRKFLLNRKNAYIDIPSEHSRVYIGEDRKGKILLTKYAFD